MTSIGTSLFSECRKLKTATIPASLSRINDDTFYNCENLTSIYIPYGVTGIGSYAFAGCTRLTSVNLPSSLTSIGNYAFQSCTKLTSIKSYIRNVFTTGRKPFSNCNSATLYVPEGLVEVYQSTPDWNKIDFIEEMPIIHDVNGDSFVNVTDIVCLIDRVLETSSDENYYYDINNDELINITDVVNLINVILNSTH